MEGVFPKAVISELSLYVEDDLQAIHCDLILSTLKIDDKKLQVPVIYIKEMMNDSEISALKNLIVLASEGKHNYETTSVVQNLFESDLFFVTYETDYLELLRTTANTMIALGYAREDFSQRLIERELRYTTVYENGVAGPHSMALNAIKDSIGVVIVRSPMFYQKKSVKLIFLINITNGDLFLYREISKMLQDIMKAPETVQKLDNVQTYQEWKKIIKTLGY